jgi:hypothetical protein
MQASKIKIMQRSPVGAEDNMGLHPAPLAIVNESKALLASKGCHCQCFCGQKLLRLQKRNIGNALEWGGGMW